LSLRPLLSLVALLVLAGCARPAAEEQIRRTLQDMAQAAGEGDVGAFMAPVADDFAADTWQLDQRGARLLLIRETRARERIRVRLLDIEIEPASADRASARFHAVLTGGSGLVPDEGSWYRVTTGWRRDGADWELINASWDRVVGR
jgi:ketosteroid isomerase-like protein